MFKLLSSYSEESAISRSSTRLVSSTVTASAISPSSFTSASIVHSLSTCISSSSSPDIGAEKGGMNRVENNNNQDISNVGPRKRGRENVPSVEVLMSSRRRSVSIIRSSVRIYFYFLFYFFYFFIFHPTIIKIIVYDNFSDCSIISLLHLSVISI